MKAAPFAYHAPTSVADAVALLARLDDARIIAGGQSLVPMLNMRYVITDHLVDINGLEELAYIREAGGIVEIGAMTRQRALLESDLLRRRLPILTEALRSVGHLQTRNRGTIGGSLCHLDPAAELPLIAALYDAVLTVTGPAGERDIPFSEWPLGYMLPALEPGEMLTRIRIVPWRPGGGWAFVEAARRHGDFALVCVAVLLETDGRDISRARIAIGGVDSCPVRLRGAEEALCGRPATNESFAEAAAIARSIQVLADAHTTGAYRQRLAGVLVARALARAAERLGSAA